MEELLWRWNKTCYTDFESESLRLERLKSVKYVAFVVR